MSFPFHPVKPVYCEYHQSVTHSTEECRQVGEDFQKWMHEQRRIRNRNPSPPPQSRNTRDRSPSPDAGQGQPNKQGRGGFGNRRGRRNRNYGNARRPSRNASNRPLPQTQLRAAAPGVPVVQESGAKAPQAEEYVGPVIDVSDIRWAHHR